MKTKQEFTNRWKHKLAGMALYGVASEINDGPVVRAGKIFDVPAEVERLLGMMYDELSASEVEPQQANGKPAANGLPRLAKA